jgi:hypothetical protein
MTPEAIKHLWRLLGQTYGQRWADQYGPTPNEAWSAFLTTIDVPRAKHGLHKAMNSGIPHPPTLPEFVAYVKTFRAAAEVHQIVDARTPADNAKVRDNLARLRDLLKS